VAVLVAAVCVVGLLGVVNLLFSFGLVRRLREHTAILDRVSSGPDQVMLPAGGRAGEFSAVTIEGAAISRQGLGADTLVGFVSTTCSACVERLPEFVRFAKRHTGPVLGVVVGSGDEAAAMIGALAGVATVVQEPGGGPVATAFEVKAFPAFGLLDAGGVVRASGLVPEALTAAAPA
jgi:hypothetical protein